ncbi:MAG TPA: HepT-like ribonuclease domain-containing protein [Thermoanaerobaculia bacterium]
MQLEARTLLFDILEAARLIQRFTLGRDFEAYAADAMLRSAVERQFEIIGEALNKLTKVDPGRASQIPEYQKIIAFRNVLIHGYATVVDDVVWGVVQTKLPLLLETVETLLGTGESAE